MVVLKKVQSLKVLAFGKSYLHVEFLVVLWPLLNLTLE